MAARIREAELRRAFDTLRGAGPRGRALAELLDARGTWVRVSRAVSGGFTLNFLNLILVQPLSQGASEVEFRRWVAVLAHEACHIEQGYWVDSVQQEMRAYASQCVVGAELGIDLGTIQTYFANLDAENPLQQLAARAALLSLFVGQPATVVYASLPLTQPTGLHTVAPALREILAVARAAFQKPKP